MVLESGSREPANAFTSSIGFSPPTSSIPKAGFKAEENISAVLRALVLPFMERMTAYLVTASPDNKVFKFQNGGIVCLDKDPESGSWMIIWTLMPKIA